MWPFKVDRAVPESAAEVQPGAAEQQDELAVKYDEHGKPVQWVRCQTLGPLAFNDQTLFVLEGKTIAAVLHHVQMRHLSLETRSSFQHPIAGLIVGSAFLVLPFWLIWGGPAWGPEALTNLYMAMSLLCLLAAGAYLVLAVLLRRPRPWLIVDTKVGRRQFLLRGDVTPEVEALVEAVAERVAAQGALPHNASAP
jgi:hypothetical protein